jgi:hypothetical protein
MPVVHSGSGLQAHLQTIGRLLLLRCGGLRVVLRKLTQRASLR